MLARGRTRPLPRSGFRSNAVTFVDPYWRPCGIRLACHGVCVMDDRVKKPRHGRITADELIAKLEADPDYQRRRAQQEARRQARMAEDAEEFAMVRAALDAAGLPSRDFGRFTSGRHPDIIRPSVFDYSGAVPVLLELLPKVTKPAVKESILRSLSTSYARPQAAAALIEEFRQTSDRDSPSLKWAIGNALATVTTPAHVDELLQLALDPVHGRGRSMVIERLGRISNDKRIVDALLQLINDEQVAFQAMGSLRRRLGLHAAAQRIKPLVDHPSERVRSAAREQLKRANKAIKHGSTRQQRSGREG